MHSTTTTTANATVATTTTTTAAIATTITTTTTTTTTTNTAIGQAFPSPPQPEQLWPGHPPVHWVAPGILPHSIKVSEREAKRSSQFTATVPSNL
jgi:hypothetical protein